MNLLLQRLLESRGYLDAADDAGSPDGMSGGAQETEHNDDGDKSDDKSVESEGASDDDKGEKSDDGKKIADETAKLLKDVMKWKEKARTTESEKSKLASTVSRLQEVLGEDYSLDDVQKIIEEKKDAERKDLEKKGEYDRILEQMKEENKKALDEALGKNAESADVIKSLQNQLEEMSVGRAFSDSNFIRENSVLPASIARKEFANYFDNVDGELVAYDKPRGAKDRTPLVDAQGNNKSFEAAIADLYAKHPDSKDLLKSKRKPGAASKTESSSKGAKPAPKTSRDKIAAGLEKLGSN